MHGLCAPEDTRDQDMADAFDPFDFTSSDAANVESVVGKEFSIYQRDCLNYARDRPVLKWISQRDDRFPHVTALARCVFAIPGSQIDNEKVFPASGVVLRTVKIVSVFRI